MLFGCLIVLIYYCVERNVLLENYVVLILTCFIILLFVFIIGSHHVKNTFAKVSLESYIMGVIWGY